MVSGQLPKVKIDGKEYTMDVRLREFRRVLTNKLATNLLTKKEDKIIPGLMIKKFEEISEKNKIELITPRQVIEKDHVVSCLTPQEYDELVDLNIKNKGVLKKIPICKND